MYKANTGSCTLMGRSELLKNNAYRQYLIYRLGCVCLSELDREDLIKELEEYYVPNRTDMYRTENG